VAFCHRPIASIVEENLVENIVEKQVQITVLGNSDGEACVRG
jgi:hypothetical protein